MSGEAKRRQRLTANEMYGVGLDSVFYERTPTNETRQAHRKTNIVFFEG